MDFSIALDTLNDMAAGLIERLPFLMVGILIFGIGWLGAKLVNSLIQRVTKNRQRHQNLALVFGRLAQWIVVFIGLLLALVVVFPSFTLGGLVEILGIGGVAIGFAFRDVLQNFLAGILILLTEPFKIGDQIIVNDYEGTVEEIQTRATFIRTYDNRQVVIPNADLFTDSVIVNTAFDRRRIEVDIGIGYSDSVEQAHELIMDVIHSTEGVLSEPAPEVLLINLGASTVDLRARWWIDPPRRIDALQTRDLVLRAVKKRFTQAGIDLPFPTQVILFHDQTEASDGDRNKQREGWPAGPNYQAQPLTISQTLKQFQESRKE